MKPIRQIYVFITIYTPTAAKKINRLARGFRKQRIANKAAKIERLHKGEILLWKLEQEARLT